MHALHCILVEVKKEYWDNGQYSPEKVEQIKKEARQEAMMCTEDTSCTVYDWRTEEDAGRWKESVPGEILGLEQPSLFKKYLKEYENRPYAEAVDRLNSALDFMETQETRRVKNGIYVDKDFLQSLWQEENFTKDMMAYNLQAAINLAAGVYDFDSFFYSAPDESSRVAKKTLQDALEHPYKYALVFSDYHR